MSKDLVAPLLSASGHIKCTLSFSVQKEVNSIVFSTSKMNKQSWLPEAHAYNPSYLGGFRIMV
jgi:hypothetical protein